MIPGPIPNASSFATTGRSRNGEPWVWLTAAGLTIGVVMAFGLFLLILVKGTSSFWPRRIDVMDVRANGAIEKIAGYVTQESERRDAQGVVHEEIQVFRGNKDLNGEAFKYIDRADIVATARPESLLLVERLEYGPAILTPVAIETPAGRVNAGPRGAVGNRARGNRRCQPRTRGARPCRENQRGRSRRGNRAPGGIANAVRRAASTRGQNPRRA